MRRQATFPLAVLAALTVPAAAYEPGTHREIGWRAVEVSGVDRILKDQFSLLAGASRPLRSNDGQTLSLREWVGFGCFNEDDRPTDRRKVFHHLTFYGFALCFASTCVATLYHYLLAREAPYPWWDLPVVLGTLGGIGLLIGPIGLLAEKSKRDPALVDETRYGMDVAFIVMLFLTSLTGLALLVLRETAAMGPLLALHLGVVFSLFVFLLVTSAVGSLARTTSNVAAPPASVVVRPDVGVTVTPAVSLSMLLAETFAGLIPS